MAPVGAHNDDVFHDVLKAFDNLEAGRRPTNETPIRTMLRTIAPTNKEVTVDAIFDLSKSRKSQPEEK
jgi:hypothetical protein